MRLKLACTQPISHIMCWPHDSSGSAELLLIPHHISAESVYSRAEYQRHYSLNRRRINPSSPGASGQATARLEGGSLCHGKVYLLRWRAQGPLFEIVPLILLSEDSTPGTAKFTTSLMEQPRGRNCVTTLCTTKCMLLTEARRLVHFGGFIDTISIV